MGFLLSIAILGGKIVQTTSVGSFDYWLLVGPGPWRAPAVDWRVGESEAEAFILTPPSKAVLNCGLHL